MTTKCTKPELLITFIKNTFPNAVLTKPTDLQTQFKFPLGLVVNVFNTGTVNFQGSSTQEQNEKAAIERQIADLNK